MSSNQEKWSKNIFFSLATIGAAVGLGNLWRFPGEAYNNGGGSFFLPFIICYLVIGLPIALLEFGMGQWSKGSVAESFKKLSPKTTWIGWWVLLNSFVIVCYYAVVMAWCLQYAIYSLHLDWTKAKDTSDFFYNNVLHLSANTNDIGSINLYTIAALAILWLSTFFILGKGIKWLSKILLFTVPIPFIIIVILAIRSISLPGGVEGITYFLKPDFSKVFTVKVWGAAAAQVILSLSLGMGQMVAYASMKKDTGKNLKSGLTLIFGDFMFSLFAGIAVFATLGYMLKTQGLSIESAEKGLGGVSLAFTTYPAAISSMPYGEVLGFLFFFMLVLLGIDSVFAVVEANVTDLKKVFPKLSKKKIIGFFCLVCFLGGLPFTMGGGLRWLDIVDHWVGYFAIFSIVLLQCIVFGSTTKIKEIAQFVGPWMNKWIFKLWRIWIVVVLPLVFVLFITSELIREYIEPFGKGGYSQKVLLILGWGAYFIALVAGIILAIRHNKANNVNSIEEHPNEVSR